MRHRVVSLGLVLGLSLMAGQADAQATLQVDGGGNLLGATGVTVDGKLYDVSFQDGTCVSLFTGCDEVTDFVFQDAPSALLASTALMTEVFVDGPAGNFDSFPALTNGCLYEFYCDIWTPYSFPSPTEVSISGFENTDGCDCDEFFTKIGLRTDDTSVVSDPDREVYAVWTPSETTPVPALSPFGLAMLCGLLGVLVLRKPYSSPSAAASVNAPDTRV